MAWIWGTGCTQHFRFKIQTHRPLGATWKWHSWESGKRICICIHGGNDILIPHKTSLRFALYMLG